MTMSGKTARARRRVADRLAEQRDLAEVAREWADTARAAGDVETADQWELWAELVENGQSIAAHGVHELRTLAHASSYLEVQIDDAVRALRTVGVSWARIGLALGLSDEGARKRFRHLAGVRPAGPPE
jgi:hypothetical protein